MRIGGLKKNTKHLPNFGGISPGTGATTGGEAVYINGEFLDGTTSITFGGTPATSVVALSSTSISCITPAHSSGEVEVHATRYGEDVYGSILFTFYNP